MWVTSEVVSPLFEQRTQRRQKPKSLCWRQPFPIPSPVAETLVNSEMAKDPVGTIIFDHVEGVNEACAEDNRRLL